MFKNSRIHATIQFVDTKSYYWWFLPFFQLLLLVHEIFQLKLTFLVLNTTYTLSPLQIEVEFASWTTLQENCPHTDFIIFSIHQTIGKGCIIQCCYNSIFLLYNTIDPNCSKTHMSRPSVGCLQIFETCHCLQICI